MVSVWLNAAFEEAQCERGVALLIWSLILDEFSDIRPGRRIKLGDLRLFNFCLVGHIEQFDRDNAAEFTALDETYTTLALKTCEMGAGRTGDIGVSVDVEEFSIVKPSSMIYWGTCRCVSLLLFAAPTLLTR